MTPKRLVTTLLVAFALLAPAAAFAQPSPGQDFVEYVNVAPSGSCSAGVKPRFVRTGPDIGKHYCCSSGTWVHCADTSGGGGTVTEVDTGTGLTGGPITTVGTVSLITPVATVNGGTELTSAADDATIVGDGSVWQSSVIPDCDDTGGNHLNYKASSNGFSCGTTDSHVGTVTSVATGTGLTGGPITTTGTIALSTPVAVANGGTNLTAAVDDNTIIGNGTTWQSKAIPDCTDASGNHLNYTASTNTLSCGTTDSHVGTVTSVATGTGLTGGPVTSSGTVSLVTPVVLANGGTNQTSWTASRCVHVNSGGTALEATGADCTTGTVTSITAGTGLTGGTITGSGTIALSTPVSVSNGGTGASSLTANALLKGNGTSAISASNETDDGHIFTAPVSVAYPFVTVAVTADTNNLNVGDASLIYIDTTGASCAGGPTDGCDITGITGGTSGRSLRLVNKGPESFNLVHASLLSTAGNRFSFASTKDQFVEAGQAVDIVYLPSSVNRWTSAGAGFTGGADPGFLVMSNSAQGSNLDLTGAPITWDSASPTDLTIFSDFGVVRVVPEAVDTIDLGAASQGFKRLYLSNGSGGDGIIATAKVETYDSITTAGKGVVPIHDVVQLTGQSADVGPSAFANDTTGLSRISYYLVTTTRGAASLETVTISWTDVSGTNQSITSAPIDLSTTGSFAQGGVFVQSGGTGGSNLSYATTNTGGFSGQAYDLYLVFENLSQ